MLPNQENFYYVQVKIRISSTKIYIIEQTVFETNNQRLKP